MLELDLDLTAEQALAECRRRGLTIVSERELAGRPGSNHWHLRIRGHAGTLELNQWRGRVWVKVHPRRQGDWAADLARELATLPTPASVTPAPAHPNQMMTPSARHGSLTRPAEIERTKKLSADETPVLDLLAKMTADSIEASGLDGETLMLVRLAALVAIDAPPASYLLNLGAAGGTGVDAEHVQGVLAAVAPIVGTSRIVSAAGKMVRAFDLKLDMAELAEDE